MKKIVAYTSLFLFSMEIIMVLASWLLCALMPEIGLRSVLSGEGIRRLFRGSVASLLTPGLAWLLMLSFAYGCVRGSGVLHVSFAAYRDRVAFYFMLLALALYVTALLLLTAVPRAVLLSATGSLFPSPFSDALVPVICLGICLASVVFGAFSGRCSGVVKIVWLFVDGIRAAAPLFILYVLAAVCIRTAAYILNFT